MHVQPFISTLNNIYFSFPDLFFLLYYEET